MKTDTDNTPKNTRSTDPELSMGSDSVSQHSDNDSERLSCAANAGAGNGAVEASCAKKRLPLFRTIAQRTTLNYVLFAVILLALLWAVFFFGMYGFYGKLLERDALSVVRTAYGVLPKTWNEEGGSELYKRRLSNIARQNSPVIIAVFALDSNGNRQVLFMLDDMGNDIQNNVLFDSIIGTMDYISVFKDDNTYKTNTQYGTFLCCGRELNADNTYLAVLKPYNLFNSQTKGLLYLLIGCTIIVLGCSCLFAYFASRVQTKRLTDFSRKAKRLADGDYDIEFSGQGYEEFENLAGALNAATKNMQKAEQLQRDIVANVSHDIRTPLTMIRAYAEMLRDMPTTEQKRRETADVIISEADRLTALTNDVLSYSKLSSGVAEFKIEKTDISSIARSVVDRFEFIRSRDGIDLVSEIDDNVTADCDKQKIEQVLYNLINNAINYCGDDKTVILRVMTRDGKARVEVTDHGVGIAKDEQSAVWDRYYRSPHSGRTAVGSGLGLSICKSIFIGHNAEYGIDSEQGAGSTFWFEL